MLSIFFFHFVLSTFMYWTHCMKNSDTSFVDEEEKVKVNWLFTEINIAPYGKRKSKAMHKYVRRIWPA